MSAKNDDEPVNEYGLTETEDRVVWYVGGAICVILIALMAFQSATI